MSTVMDITGYENLIISIVLSIPIVVSILGYVLYTTPTMLHQKRDLGALGQQSLIGHRGSRLEGIPENTIAAFREAMKVTRFLELDVWLTKDNHVVVHHDDTFKRMTNGEVTHAITELCYHEFPRIHHNLPSQSNRIHEHHHHDCLRFPTFEDVLRTTPSDVHFIIEFKQDSELLIKLVHDLLRKYNRINHPHPAHADSSTDDGSAAPPPPMDFWFSLNEKINQKLLRYDPAIPRITSVIGMLKVLLYYYTGVLPFVGIEEQAFGVTLEAISYVKLRGEKSVKGAPRWLLRILAFCLRGKPPAAFIQPALFAHMRARGMPVYFLGVNSEKELMIAIKSGATGVLSDRITYIANYMAKHPELQFKKIE